MKWTLHAASKEFGIHRQTLGTRLAAAGHAVTRGATFHTRDIVAAIHGDHVKMRLRLLTARTLEIEANNARRAGLVVERDAVQSTNNEVVAMIGAELDRLFLTELPPALKGLDEQSIKERCKEAIASFWSAVRRKLEQMYRDA